MRVITFDFDKLTDEQCKKLIDYIPVLPTTLALAVKQCLPELVNRGYDRGSTLLCSDGALKYLENNRRISHRLVSMDPYRSEVMRDYYELKFEWDFVIGRTVSSLNLKNKGIDPFGLDIFCETPIDLIKNIVRIAKWYFEWVSICDKLGKSEDSYVARCFFQFRFIPYMINVSHDINEILAIMCQERSMEYGTTASMYEIFSAFYRPAVTTKENYYVDEFIRYLDNICDMSKTTFIDIVAIEKFIKAGSPLGATGQRYYKPGSPEKTPTNPKPYMDPPHKVNYTIPEETKCAILTMGQGIHLTTECTLERDRYGKDIFQEYTYLEIPNASHLAMNSKIGGKYLLSCTEDGNLVGQRIPYIFSMQKADEYMVESAPYTFIIEEPNTSRDRYEVLIKYFNA